MESKVRLCAYRTHAKLNSRSTWASGKPDGWLLDGWPTAGESETCLNVCAIFAFLCVGEYLVTEFNFIQMTKKLGKCLDSHLLLRTMLAYHRCSSGVRFHIENCSVSSVPVPPAHQKIIKPDAGGVKSPKTTLYAARKLHAPKQKRTASAGSGSAIISSRCIYRDNR